jgi:hypothetical protein
MDKVYSEKDMPRYAKTQVDSHIQRFAKLKVGCNVTLKELWDGSRTSSFVPLEESRNEVWTYGRFVCLGDSIHKMTPNVGIYVTFVTEILTVPLDGSRRKYGS